MRDFEHMAAALVMSALTDTCPKCRGTGHMLNPELNELHKEAAEFCRVAMQDDRGGLSTRRFREWARELATRLRVTEKLAPCDMCGTLGRIPSAATHELQQMFIQERERRRGQGDGQARADEVMRPVPISPGPGAGGFGEV